MQSYLRLTNFPLSSFPHAANPTASSAAVPNPNIFFFKVIVYFLLVFSCLRAV